MFAVFTNGYCHISTDGLYVYTILYKTIKVDD